ncbi:gamma-tubulin complex component 2-like [Melitaea cinxia]|uniref:gamma-tubulin complex component 2-like n=1 Tax=Melitaea cinxia TaxID=113334 RepID=UPI001E273CD0|nr:gamma-tubulin complex component 2-like [Melitaea cinxia]
MTYHRVKHIHPSSQTFAFIIFRIKDKLLKAVDESKKLVMKSFEEKESKLRPNWYNSLDLPNWQKDHPAMSWDFPKDPLPIILSLSGIPVSSQENIIIDELLYLFSGISGNYIVHQPVKDTYDPRTFIISDDLDDALKQIVQQMLPLASNYSIVRRFIEHCNMWSGQVLHALVAAIEILLKDYYTMIAQLETEHMSTNLTLQKLWYFVLPTMHTMQILAAIVTSIGKSELRGGAVLTVLHEKTNTLMGDARAQEISLFLTERSCRPYLCILDQWIHKGTIVDPFQEFMIEDNELINKEELPVDYSADYWEKRYSVQRDRVPKFLDKFTDIILRTGKYLNVISQCGKAITKSNTEEIKYSLREQNYGAIIQKAYAFASKSLLELLLKEYDLMGRLKSVKNYFLMSQGDFIVQFMDATEQELSKKIDDIIPSKLESLLGLCLRLSAASHDPYNEDMRVELLPYDLQFQMFKILSIETEEEKEYKQNKDCPPLTGIETFSFGMEVKWPVSLILNHKAIACYQMIFRHLFYCKHVERLLCRVWLYNKVVKRFSEARLYADAFALRQRMLSCVQHLQYYMCVEVIEPSWCQLIQSLDKDPFSCVLHLQYYMCVEVIEPSWCQLIQSLDKVSAPFGIRSAACSTCSTTCASRSSSRPGASSYRASTRSVRPLGSVQLRVAPAVLHVRRGHRAVLVPAHTEPRQGQCALRDPFSCVQHLQYYMCVEVIEPSWCQLIQSLDKVSAPFGIRSAACSTFSTTCASRSSSRPGASSYRASTRSVRPSGSVQLRAAPAVLHVRRGHRAVLVPAHTEPRQGQCAL